MQRYKAEIQYDGTDYVGFQVQENGPSIQAELNKALLRMTKGIPVPVTGSGRTDSGVHALGQVVHFDYPADIPSDQVIRALNSLLPKAIRVNKVETVPSDFHARYSTVGKAYLYRVSTQRILDPFRRHYCLHHPYATDWDRVNQALEAVVGRYDFTSFCSTKTDKDDKVRLVTRAQALEEGDEWHFHFEGEGFLYNMVRILVGTSLQIGDGLRPVEDMAAILKAQDRAKAGPTAPAHGLYLRKVFYETEKGI